MSDNYKTISKAKEAALNLKSQGWTNSGVATEMGISFILLTEILEYDPVSVNVREGTMEKLRDFIARHESGIVKPEKKKTGPKKKKLGPKKKEPEFKIEVPDSMVDAIPNEIGIETGPKDDDGNLLQDLNVLAERFAKSGYRLNANIELIYEPE